MSSRSLNSISLRVEQLLPSLSPNHSHAFLYSTHESQRSLYKYAKYWNFLTGPPLRLPKSTLVAVLILSTAIIPGSGGYSAGKNSRSLASEGLGLIQCKHSLPPQVFFWR